MAHCSVASRRPAAERDRFAGAAETAPRAGIPGGGDDDDDDDDAGLDLPQPTPHAAARYQYVRLEDVPAQLFGWGEGGGMSFSRGQLVWVCKSKGRRRRSVAVIDDGADDGECEKRNQQQPQAGGGPPCDAIERRAPQNGFLYCGSPSGRLELFLRARVEEDFRVCASGSAGARVLVRYPQGSTYRVRADRLIPVLDGGSDPAKRAMVVVARETPEYRRCCAVHCLPHESFLEIGSDLGHNLERVHRRTGGQGSTPGDNRRRRLVGVDKSQASIDAARSSYPHLDFVRWDALEEPVGALLDGLGLAPGQGFRPDVVAVDINGTRELPAVLRCLRAVFDGAGWGPRLVVVKSRALHARLGAAAAAGAARGGDDGDGPRPWSPRPPSGATAAGRRGE